MKVAAYLKKKGFRKAELARLCGFKNRQNVDRLIKSGWHIRDTNKLEREVFSWDAIWYQPGRPERLKGVIFDVNELAKINQRQA